MAAITVASERDYLIANARHVRAMLQKHIAELRAFGVKDTLLRRFDQSISIADVANDAQVADSQRQLDEARFELKNLVGRLRGTARLVADNFDGFDAEAGAALKVKARFPHSDRALLAYCQSVSASFRRYSARLAELGFVKADQEGVVALSASMRKLIAARRKEKSGKRSASVSREAAFEQLRKQISWFRELARLAFRNMPERSDFDPVSKVRAGQGNAGPAARPGVTLSRRRWQELPSSPLSFTG
jgi:hypothetical protein